MGLVEEVNGGRGKGDEERSGKEKGEVGRRERTEGRGRGEMETGRVVMGSEEKREGEKIRGAF